MYPLVMGLGFADVRGVKILSNNESGGVVESTLRLLLIVLSVESVAGEGMDSVFLQLCSINKIKAYAKNKEYLQDKFFISI